MNFRILVALAALAGTAQMAGAQSLPAPAPQPASPRPTSQSPQTPPADPPFFAPAPPSQEYPIIIGEPPVRATGPVPTVAPAADNPAVGGVTIKGLADGPAVKKLKEGLDARLKAPVRLIVGEYQYTFLRQELGAEIPYWPLMRAARTRGANVPLTFHVAEATTIAALRELDKQVREDFGTTALNVGGSAVRIRQALEANPPREAVELTTVAIKETPARVVAAAPKAPALAGAPSRAHPYLLTEFSTRYDAGLRGRTTNLKIAARNMNGTKVAPGQVFSANKAIGPRDAASGWKEAMMFVSGRVVSGVGSGICQTSSTLYNAALLADLPIVERHAHSMRVTYVPPSQDASLLWNAKDFKFRNNTGGEILVQTYVSKGRFFAKLWTDTPSSPSRIRVQSRVINKDKTGTWSEAYKIMDGKTTRVSRDFYRPHP